MRKKKLSTRAVEWARDFEPARARGVFVAVVALAAAVGYGEFAEGFEAHSTAIIGILSGASALVTAEVSRRKVYSPETVHDMLVKQAETIEGTVGVPPEYDEPDFDEEDEPGPEDDRAGDEGLEVEDADVVERLDDE